MEKRRYDFEELSATNTAAPVFTTVTAQATLSGSTNTLTGHVYTPQTPEAFTYDTDGNLTQDGRWNYTWDAENRLVNMTPISTVPAAAKKTLQFAYDYMGRRISKSVATWNTSTGAYRTAVETRFIYDGWNLVAETDATGKLLRNYVWGTDLSGTPQGAGGIGGLLMVTNAAPTLGQTHTYFPTYDGNGNVASLVKSTDVIPRASYEYGPFGEVLRQSGSYATTNPFRFSTKYEDEETGFDYYGHRFYDPATGRWTSRDPSAQDASFDLYGYVANSLISRVDALGLKILSLAFYGDGDSSVPANDWTQGFDGNDDLSRIATSPNTLGFHGGTYYPLSFLSAITFGFNKGAPWAAGMFKWETHARWCITYNKQQPTFTHTISNVIRTAWRQDGTSIDLGSFTGPQADGPHGQIVSIRDQDGNDIPPGGQTTIYSYDAPFISDPVSKFAIASFSADWEVKVEDYINAWKGKLRVWFSYNSSSPGAGSGGWTTIEAPHEITGQ